MIWFLLGCDRLAALSGTVPTPPPPINSLPLPPGDCRSTGAASPARNCLSGELACGATITSTTLGGDSAYDDAFYAQNFCFPAGDHHSGSERVFHFTAPANSDVVVRLESSCVDLDLVAFTWDYEGSCPTGKHLISECNGDDKRSGNGSVHLVNFTERQYLVVVDGKAGAVGPFSLTADCRALRTLEERAAPLPKDK